MISDAGTPGISDPGSRAVAAVADGRATRHHRAGTVGGRGGADDQRTADRALRRWRVSCRASAGERDALYAQWVNEPRTIVFYESPQRLAATLDEMVASARPATCRRRA